MTEIIATIVSYVSIWMPSIIAVAGMIGSFILAISRISSAFKGNQKALEEIKNDKAFIELKGKIDVMINENQQLREQNALLLDEITQIKGYVDQLKKEGKVK